VLTILNGGYSPQSSVSAPRLCVVAYSFETRYTSEVELFNV